jgi:hypothetical protein
MMMNSYGLWIDRQSIHHRLPTLNHIYDDKHEMSENPMLPQE